MKQVVAALIIRGERAERGEEILICQRTKHQVMPLKWEFPGGKIEANEEPAEALHRELEEELGIRSEIGDKVATLQYNYQNGGAVELHFFLVRQYEGEIQNRIFRDVRWVHRKDLPGFDFLEADVALVNDIAAGKVF
ncbi:MAG TPA: (deoxy)nucleoside triphosphate pyrophosphohydrolase [Candidatus Angelobacter sp.]|nr:(deoxy)nucleoside triphosphate pyrophosphohydrolase [Candidatus Angelobacter sp.]